MRILVNLDDLYACDKCGLVFDKSNVKTIRKEYETTKFICPHCKHKNVIDVE